MTHTRLTVLAILASAGISATATAQPLGSFSWQLQPFCNRVTVTVTQNGAIYTMDGYDDQCSAGQRAPVVGIATPNPDGSIGFGWTVVTVPGGKPVHVDARIDLGSLGGAWSDSAGNTGTLVLNGQAAGSPRPAPSAPGIPPGSVTSTALAPGAVTTAAISDGTIGAADVNTAEVQQRIAGQCGTGLFITSVAVDGIPACGDGSTQVGSVALGTGALSGATSGGGNVAVGSSALSSVAPGNRNIAIGAGAMVRGGGADNIGLGINALNVTTGAWNIGIGSRALFSNTTGAFNVGVGADVLGDVTAANNNTAVGFRAMISATGGDNTAVGYLALAGTTGSSNIALGRAAGNGVSTGSNNIHIGHLGTGDTDTIRVGTAQTRAFLAGVRGVTTATAAIPVLVGTDGQLGTVSSSRRFKQDIADMDDFSARVARLRPVTFRYAQPAADGSKPLDFGLIAEEVADVFPELAVTGSDGQIETVAYHKLPALLLNELQTLQRVVETQKRELSELRALVESRQR